MNDLEKRESDCNVQKGLVKFRKIAKENGLDVSEGMGTWIATSKENDKWSCFVNAKTLEVKINYYNYIGEIIEEEIEIDEILPEDLRNFFINLMRVRAEE